MEVCSLEVEGLQRNGQERQTTAIDYYPDGPKLRNEDVRTLLTARGAPLPSRSLDRGHPKHQQLELSRVNWAAGPRCTPWIYGSAGLFGGGGREGGRQ